MKKWLWMLAGLMAAAALGSGETAGTDVGKLQPVQVVCLARLDGIVSVCTDTGEQGTGPDLKSAVENMKACAAGEIFLETADHLLLMPDCLELLEEAAALLRPSCTLCLLDGEPNMERIGPFLDLHAPAVTLMEYRAGWGQLQTLKTADGRMCLVS